jgi:hypothetical protein
LDLVDVDLVDFNFLGDCGRDPRVSSSSWRRFMDLVVIFEKNAFDL